jgi:pSer/pThr/pTyr-binding forkhead associated (FHA) protein
MWKLVIEDDEGKRTVVPLTRDEYSIGRREGNVIRLTERNVSREHARLYKKGAPAHTRADFVLEDLTSYNGVFVNGLRVHHSHDLVHGDLVQIGDYRIILQNEAAEQGAGNSADAKQTLPNSPMARSAGLLDRPNRLVMLAGPTPGAEYPLDRDRLTVGRAEDASISINHNSVSRLHCEVHALGDGRFEIVDKGSSNGVRVNGADLRRGIVEPGDVIELGDVRFKFVGAGQIFRPTESQQLSAITDRDAADIVRGRRSHGALPFAVFAVVVVAGAAGAWVYTRPRMRASSSAAAVAAPEQAVLDEAKRICGGGAGDCELAHTKIESAIPESSHFRESQAFKDIESQWAQSLIDRADTTADLGAKRELYQRVAQTVGVDPTRRKVAADRLQQLDSSAAAVSANAMELPIAPPPSASAPSSSSNSSKARDEALAVSTHTDSGRRGAVAAAEPAATGASPSPAVTPASVEEKERQLALQGTPDAKLALKQQLETRVYGGRASDAEIRLLISTCKDLGDRSCVQQARAVQSQKSTP